MSRTGEGQTVGPDETPEQRQSDDVVGRLLDDGDPDEEATAVARRGEDVDDEIRSMEERAMHMTKPPPFHDSDGYVAED